MFLQNLAYPDNNPCPNQSRYTKFYCRSSPYNLVSPSFCSLPSRDEIVVKSMGEAWNTVLYSKFYIFVADLLFHLGVIRLCKVRKQLHFLICLEDRCTAGSFFLAIRVFLNIFQNQNAVGGFFSSAAGFLVFLRIKTLIPRLMKFSQMRIVILFKQYLITRLV